MAKKSANSFDGERGTGWMDDPEKAAYHILYKKSIKEISSVSNGAHAKSAKYSGMKKPKKSRNNPSKNSQKDSIEDKNNKDDNNKKKIKNPIFDDRGEVRPVALIIGMIVFAGLIYLTWCYGSPLIKVLMFMVLLYLLIRSVF